MSKLSGLNARTNNDIIEYEDEESNSGIRADPEDPERGVLSIPTDEDFSS